MIADETPVSETPFAYHRVGNDVAYMARASGPDGTCFGGAGFYRENTLVTCNVWDGPDPHPEGLAASGGIFGFVDAEGDWYHAFEIGWGDTFQILKIKRSEVVQEFDGCRVPRAWVQYSGSFREVVLALRGEGNEYATKVSDNLIIGVAKGRVALRRYLSNPAGYYDVVREAFANTWAVSPLGGRDDRQ